MVTVTVIVTEGGVRALAGTVTFRRVDVEEGWTVAVVLPNVTVGAEVPATQPV